MEECDRCEGKFPSPVVAGTDLLSRLMSKLDYGVRAIEKF
jgi:hypothetical protein